MQIKPEDKTIKAVLNCGNTYVIPRFQREYSWEKNNYREFLEDMIKSLEISDGIIKTSDYFIGTMLFINDSISKEIQVVDGQQRLTTITILFSALSDHFIKIGNETLSKQIFKYIMTEDDNGEEVRILKSKSHYPYFAYYIQDRTKDEEPKAESEEEICIFQTYQYLYDATEENVLRQQLKLYFGDKEVENIEYIDILKALRDQVLQTIVISISTVDKTQANMIFEILNAKGKRLANVDLIKNKLFEILKKTEPADFAEITWKEIKNKLYNSKADIGFATFYRHFWISKYKKSSTNKLYDDFNKVLPKTEDSYKKFLEEMNKNVDWYVQILDPTRKYFNNKKEYFPVVHSLNMISNYFGIVQARIAILGLFDLKTNNRIKCSIFEKSIQYIEKFHFAYNEVYSGRSNSFEKIYTDFAIAARKCKDSVEAKNCIENLLVGKLEKIYPTYEQFESKFIKLTYSKKNNKDNLKTKYAVYVLYGLSEKKDYTLFPDDGSIEHIISEKESLEALNIGNLIALENKINQKCNSLKYEEKVKFYKESKYQCIKDFVDENKSWDSTKIQRRAKEMAKQIYNDFLRNICIY